jgi:hypothetical protein
MGPTFVCASHEVLHGGRKIQESVTVVKQTIVCLSEEWRTLEEGTADSMNGERE